MITQAAVALTGDDLLNRVKELGDVDKGDLLRGCGYATYEDGEEKLLFKEFYNALLEAKGIDTNWDEMNETGRKVFGEYTHAQMLEWWREARLDFKQFGELMPNAVKWIAIMSLEGLAAIHRQQAENKNTDENEREFWKADAEKLEDIIARVQGVHLGGDESQSKEYEEKNPVDPYLSTISDDSLEVLKHFGAETPNLLNNYSCALEDALIEQTKKVQELSQVIEGLTGVNPNPGYAEKMEETRNNLKGALRR